MKQRFLSSVVACALIGTAVSGEDTLMQRFEKMEKEIAALKAELNAVKKAEAEKASAVVEKKVEVAQSEEHKDVGKAIEDLQDQIATINKKTNGNNLKFGVDFRTSYDNLQYHGRWQQTKK